MGLPHGEEIMIVCQTMWAQSTSVTDGQTVRRTNLRWLRLCLASRGKNDYSVQNDKSLRRHWTSEEYSKIGI